MMSKLRSKPPAKTVARVEEFIAGADKKAEEGSTVQQEEPEEYPWEAPGIRDDVLKIYNLRIPEPYLLKLKYIAEHTPDT